MLVRLLGAWLMLAWIAVCRAGAMAAEPPPIFVGGQFIRQHAIADQSGHLLVPVRGIFEALHAGVTYTPPRIVVVRKNGIVVAGLVVGRNHAVVGNRPRNLAVAPIRRAGRIYVPLRMIAELAGATVTYSVKPRLVDIRVPFNELAPLNSARELPEIPSDAVVPLWGYALVGLFVLGFAAELTRRVVASGPRQSAGRTTRAQPALLAPHALQLSHAVDAGDQHGIGQITK